MADKRRSKASSQKSREELRRENRQAIERKKHRNQIILIFSLVAVIVAAAVVLSLTVFFKVSAVEVDASKTQYKAEQIRDASGITIGESLFLMDREQVAESIGRQLPYTGEITVKRSLPTKVKITVEDSTIKTAVRYNDQFIVLNENRKVLAKVGSIDRLNQLVEQQETIRQQMKKTGKTTTKKAGAKSTSTTTSTSETTTAATTTTATTAAESTTALSGKEIAGGEDLSAATDKVTIITGIQVKSAKVGHVLKAKNSEMFETCQQIMDAMASWGVKDITAIDVSKVSDLRLTYQKRITILLGSATSLDRKAALCAKVLEEQNKVSTEQKGTVDLSIEGKAYFSEGGATTRTTTTTVSSVSETLTTTEIVTDVDGNPISTTTETVTGEGESTTSTTRDPADIGG